MKLKNILKYVSPIMIGLTPFIPLTTSCSNEKSFNLDNIEITGESGPEKIFGYENNFKAEIDYEFTIDMNKWKVDYGKPESETKWKDENCVNFVICSNDYTRYKLNNTNNIKIMCDGQELKQGTKEEVEEGNANWYLDDCTSEVSSNISYCLCIDLTDGLPVTYASSVKIQNINFNSNYQDVLLSWQNDY